MTDALSLQQALAREWTHLGASRAARIEMCRWSVANRQLAAWPHPKALVEACDQLPPAEANAVLGAVLRAGGPLAHRTVLQALLPAVGSLVRRLGWGLGHDGDAEGEIVATVYEVIGGIDPDDPFPAARIVGRAYKRLRRRARAATRSLEWHAVSVGADWFAEPVDSEANRDRTEAAVRQLVGWTAEGRLDRLGAAIVYSHMVLGIRQMDLADRLGVHPDCVRGRMRRTLERIERVAAA